MLISWEGLFFHVCLFVCSHDTARISQPIFMKFAVLTSNFCLTKPIDFGQDQIQNGGSGGHFVFQKICKNTFFIGTSSKFGFTISNVSSIDFYSFILFTFKMADFSAILYGYPGFCPKLISSYRPCFLRYKPNLLKCC